MKTPREDPIPEDALVAALLTSWSPEDVATVLGWNFPAAMEALSPEDREAEAFCREQIARVIRKGRRGAAAIKEADHGRPA